MRYGMLCHGVSAILTGSQVPVEYDIAKAETASRRNQSDCWPPIAGGPGRTGGISTRRWTRCDGRCFEMSGRGQKFKTESATNNSDVGAMADAHLANGLFGGGPLWPRS
jgi:hypothetical protein